MWQVAELGEVEYWVSETDPVCVLRRAGQPDLVSSWPDLPLGKYAVDLTVYVAPGGVWATYAATDAWETSASAAAVHIAPDGSQTRFTSPARVTFLGATRHGLWLDPADRTVPDPGDPDWDGDQALVLLPPDGAPCTVVVDRRYYRAFDDGQQSRLLGYLGPPEEHRETDEAGWLASTYTHHPMLVILPAVVPDRLAVAELPVVPLDDETAKDRLVEVLGTTTTTHCVAGPADPGVRWPLAPLGDAEKEQAIATWRAQLPAPGTSPTVEPMTDIRLDESGDWPHTVLALSFRHPAFGEGRIRRRYRVFDDAGRIIEPIYPQVHLMEDLDTRDLPPASAADNGVLDITADDGLDH